MAREVFYFMIFVIVCGAVLPIMYPEEEEEPKCEEVASETAPQGIIPEVHTVEHILYGEENQEELRDRDRKGAQGNLEHKSMQLWRF